MLNNMYPNKNKVIIHPSMSTPKKITLISKGIDYSSTLSQQYKSSMSVTHKKFPPRVISYTQKTHKPIVRKIPKNYHGGYYSTESYDSKNKAFTEQI